MTSEELFALHIDEPDKSVYDKAKEHFDLLAKPIDGFGDLEDMICRIAAIQGIASIFPNIFIIGHLLSLFLLL